MNSCPNPVCASEQWQLLAIVGTDHRQVVCPDCGMSGPIATTADDAIALWESLPRATKQGQRDLLYKAIHDAYQNEPGITYEILADRFDCAPSTIGRRILKYREMMKKIK